MSEQAETATTFLVLMSDAAKLALGFDLGPPLGRDVVPLSKLQR